MGLSALLARAEDSGSDHVSVTFLAQRELVEWVEHLSEELPLSKSAIWREAIFIGVSHLQADWEQALENGKKGKRK